MLAAVSILLLFAQGVAEERKQLTEGVGELVTQGGVPGVMVASGSPAFVVLTGRSGAAKAPVFVATHLGKGRALAGGHDVFFGASQIQNEANRRFLSNALTWLGRRPLNQLHIGYLSATVPTDFLRKAGAQQVDISRENLSERLKTVQVVCMRQGALDGDLHSQGVVLQFIRDGGGLLIAGPAWGWQQLSRGKSLVRDHTGNRLLGDYGIGFSGSMADAPFSPAGADDPVLTTLGAIDLLQRNPNLDQSLAGIGSLERALSLAPDGDKSLQTQIVALAAKESGGEPTPTLKKPVTWATPFSRVKVSIDYHRFDDLGPKSVVKHPTADAFPGEIPAGAARIQRRVMVDTSVADWHATGTYAAPGEVVTVVLPEEAISLGLNVRIGPHKDSLWGADKWSRFPEVAQETPLRRAETQIASQFGGLIYIDVPWGAQAKTVPITIKDVVASPLFVLGKTNKTEWAEANASPAPWADLQGRYIAISLPHRAIVKLTDPAALMTYWDEVAGHCADLYGVPKPVRPERYCVDRQITNGYMHSGYPIMTHEDVAETFADVSKLRAKAGPVWGFYHELGHNFQRPDWTWDGCGEVTNNLFSLYGNEMLNEITPQTYGLAHPNIEPVSSRERLAQYLSDGAPYERWKSDPFLALSMFVQLRVAFGWDAFKKVFAEYHRLPDAERPKTDEEKRNQWMVRFSRTVHRNLGPFFVAWGVPTSASARVSVASLPPWMPADWPGKPFASREALSSRGTRDLAHLHVH